MSPFPQQVLRANKNLDFIRALLLAVPLDAVRERAFTPYVYELFYEVVNRFDPGHHSYQNQIEGNKHLPGHPSQIPLHCWSQGFRKQSETWA